MNTGLTDGARVSGIEDVPIEELRQWDRNPRHISSASFERLKRSMTSDPDMLLARPVIALPDGRVVAGNMRLAAALELGWTSIPAVRAQLDEHVAATWALRDNNPYGEWDETALADLLHELHDADVDLAATGFAEEELQRLLARVDDVEPVERGVDLALTDVSIGDPVHETRVGQVWQLGEHVLVIASVYDGWPQWSQLLHEGDLFVPYPTPTLPLTQRANAQRLVMVQPDPWLAGHVLDKYASVRGDAEVQQR